MKKLLLFLIVILIVVGAQIAKIQTARSDWGVDALITGPSNQSQINPSMTSSPNGDLYVASESIPGVPFITITRSTDEGASWGYLAEFTIPGVVNLCNPSITYAERSGRSRLYVAYEANYPDGSKSVQVLCLDPDNPSIRHINTIASHIHMGTPSEHIHPHICTDNLLFSHYYIYVTYTEYAVDYYPAMFSRSMDFGVTWSTPQDLTGEFKNSGFQTRPHIAFGSTGLFVAFEKLGWTGRSWDNQIFITKSTNYGNSWDTPVQLTNSSDNQYHPRVAVTIGLQSVVVAYTRNWRNTGDLDVCYACSTNGGSSWTRDRWLPRTTRTEDSVELSVSNYSGRFHAAFWRDNEIHYTWADASTPFFLNSTVVVNDTRSASRNYSKPAVCVNPMKEEEEEACVAWTDFRSILYGIYSDTASALP